MGGAAQVHRRGAAWLGSAGGSAARLGAARCSVGDLARRRLSSAAPRGSAAPLRGRRPDSAARGGSAAPHGAVALPIGRLAWRGGAPRELGAARYGGSSARWRGGAVARRLGSAARRRGAVAAAVRSGAAARRRARRSATERDEARSAQRGARGDPTSRPIQAFKHHRSQDRLTYCAAFSNLGVGVSSAPRPDLRGFEHGPLGPCPPHSRTRPMVALAVTAPGRRGGSSSMMALRNASESPTGSVIGRWQLIAWAITLRHET